MEFPVDPFYIGIVAGVLTSVSSAPQLIKIIREKKSKDLSNGMLIVLIAGVSLWIGYGILIDDTPIIITNCISVVITSLTLFFSNKYKEKTSS